MKHSDDVVAAYIELIHKYHRALDLMSARGLETLPLKIEDARCYASALADIDSGDGVADVGSGVGLPGIVVAIHCPNLTVSLVERRKRRASFLNIVVAQLSLENVKVLNEDVGQVALGPVSAITAQAVTDFHSLYCLTRHFHRARIHLISRKGPSWLEEKARLDEALGEVSEVAYNTALQGRGRLIALRLSGGLACRSSA